MPTFAFSKYFNLPNSLARYGTPESQQAAWANNPNEEGTQYNNGDARYMTGAYAFAYGDALALHGRLPTTPKTYNGQKEHRRRSADPVGHVRHPVAGHHEDLPVPVRRHPPEQEAQLRDRLRQVADAARVTPPASVASPGCPADPDGDGAGRPDTGLLLTRNVLPSADFKKSSWSVTSPFNAKEIMGDYYPKGNYMAKKAFESHGCPFKWK